MGNAIVIGGSGSSGGGTAVYNWDYYNTLPSGTFVSLNDFWIYDAQTADVCRINVKVAPAGSPVTTIDILRTRSATTLSMFTGTSSGPQTVTTTLGYSLVSSTLALTDLAVGDIITAVVVAGNGSCMFKLDLHVINN